MFQSIRILTSHGHMFALTSAKMHILKNTSKNDKKISKEAKLSTCDITLYKNINKYKTYPGLRLRLRLRLRPEVKPQGFWKNTQNQEKLENILKYLSIYTN